MEENNKYIKIGKCYTTNGVKSYECGYVREWDVVGDGYMGCVAFKDEEVFLKEPDEICYIPEFAFSECRPQGEGPYWHLVTLDSPREESIYKKPWSYTANELRELCADFLRTHPRFKFDLDDFTYFFFKSLTCFLDESDKVDPWDSVQSILEIAMQYEKMNSAEEQLIKGLDT